jgi:hypothetical protein
MYVRVCARACVRVCVMLFIDSDGPILKSIIHIQYFSLYVH